MLHGAGYRCYICPGVFHVNYLPPNATSKSSSANGPFPAADVVRWLAKGNFNYKGQNIGLWTDVACKPLSASGYDTA